jgi:protoporphyrinogen oxidase
MARMALATASPTFAESASGNLALAVRGVGFARLQAHSWAAMMSPRTVSPLCPGEHVVVIGAGPAGLTAAYLLSKQGVRVTVLEGSDTVGGLSQTAQYKGFRFDIGGHRFFTKIQPVQELWEEVLGDQFISVPRLSRIYYDGKFFDYPLKAGNALKGLGVVKAASILLSWLKWRFKPYPVEETFEQWVTNRFGKRLFEIFFKTYTEKVWGMPCCEIRAEWAAQRIQNLSLDKAILAAASLSRRSTRIKTLIHEFRYPRLGPGQMWQMCRDRIVAMGNHVHLRHHVTGIDMSDGRVCAVRAQTDDGERLFPADHVISTTSLRSLVRALEPHAPESARVGARGLRYRDFLVVALILNRDDLFPDNWLYIHSPGVKVGRIQNFNNWSRALVPEAGKTCLGLEYFCFEGDGLWSSTDSELIATASRELEEIGLAPASDVEDATVIRMKKAYPIYDCAYRDHLDAVRAFVDPIPNLHTVGRNGMHKYNNQDHSMLTAMMALWNMRGASYDVWAVNTDFDYHEEQKLADDNPAELAGSAPGAEGAAAGQPETRRLAS